MSFQRQIGRSGGTKVKHGDSRHLSGLVNLEHQVAVADLVGDRVHDILAQRRIAAATTVCWPRET
jgi:hypothetical protein